MDGSVTLSFALRRAASGLHARGTEDAPLLDRVSAAGFSTVPAPSSAALARKLVDSHATHNLSLPHHDPEFWAAVVEAVPSIATTTLCAHPRDTWRVGDVLCVLEQAGAVAADKVRGLLRQCGTRRLADAVYFGPDSDDVLKAYKKFLWGDERTVRWYAFGDWGMSGLWPSFAKELHAMARVWGPPQFVTAVGDNIYPSGTTSVNAQVWADWEDSFGEGAQPILRVPWYLAIGNHDYVFSKEGRNAEVDYTHACRHKRWRMPAFNYQFGAVPHPGVMGAADHPPLVEFFTVDTNAVQYAIRRQIPSIVREMKEYLPVLKERILASPARWKVVLAHHPCYTGGDGHQSEARCLRGKVYAPIKNPTLRLEGMDFESLLVECGVDLFIAGHEHVCQHTFHRGVHHLVVGASIETHYYNGKWNCRGGEVKPTPEDPHRSIQMTSSCVDWCCDDTCCVAVCQASSSQLQIGITATATAALVRTITITKEDAHRSQE